MKERINDVDVYLRQLEGSPKDWEETIIDYMRKNYPE